MKKISLVSLLIILLNVFCYSAEKWYKGMCVGIVTPYHQLKGDFFGKGYFSYQKDGNQINIIIPEIEPAFGYGILLGSDDGGQKGHLFTQLVNWEFEFEYILFNQNGKWWNRDFQVTHRVVDIGFIAFFKPGEKTQPYFGISPYLTWLEIKNGAYDHNWNLLGNPTIIGAGGNLEFGMRYNVSKNFFISGGLLGTLEIYSNGEFDGDKGNVNNPPNAYGINFNLKTIYKF